MDEKEEMECVEEMGDIFVGERELEREVELKEKEEKVDTEMKGKKNSRAALWKNMEQSYFTTATIKRSAHSTNGLEP